MPAGQRLGQGISLPSRCQCNRQATPRRRILWACRSKPRSRAKLTRNRYRNIQMMISYIQNAQADGYDCIPGKLPTIVKLQDMIEYSWDAGFGSVARVETGGIRATRKYIGTPEVCESLWRLSSIDLGRHKLYSTAWESGRSDTLLLWNPAQSSLDASLAHTSLLQTPSQLI